MKTKKQIKLFIKELEDLCKKHDIYIDVQCHCDCCSDGLNSKMRLLDCGGDDAILHDLKLCRTFTTVFYESIDLPTWSK